MVLGMELSFAQLYVNESISLVMNKGAEAMVGEAKRSTAIGWLATPSLSRDHCLHSGSNMNSSHEPVRCMWASREVVSKGSVVWDMFCVVCGVVVEVLVEVVAIPKMGRLGFPESAPVGL